MWRVCVVVLIGCGSSSPMTPLDAAPAGPPEPLIPLAPRNAWTYAWTLTAGDKTTACTLTDTLTGTLLVDGRMASVDTHARDCAKGTTTSTSYIAETDDAIEMRAMTAVDWLRLDPPEDGHTWNAGETGDEVDYTWHRADDVTVAAGTFSACWLADAGDLQETYCRGVGLVLSDETHANQSVTHLELTSKSF